MKLTADEKAMLDGSQGKAKQKTGGAIAVHERKRSRARDRNHDLAVRDEREAVDGDRHVVLLPVPRRVPDRVRQRDLSRRRARARVFDWCVIGL
mgnify:CR=1 FL=1